MVQAPSSLKQIFRLEEFSIKSVGVLDFNHYRGVCGNMNDEFIFLCFGEHGKNKCRRATGPLDQFTEIARSNEDHVDTQISASISKFINQLKVL